MIGYKVFTFWEVVELGIDIELLIGLGNEAI